MKIKNIATIFAILAAALYAINIPFSKMLLVHVDETMMAAFLYLGAGIGMIIYGFVNKLLGNERKKEHLTKKELPSSLIAFVIFKEVISKRLWLAIGLVTIASVILSFEGNGAFMFNEGSLFVLGACTCWGLENNCTKMISNKSSEETVVIKGCFLLLT